MITIKMATGDKNVILVDPHWVDGIPHSKLVSEETIRRLPDTPVYEDDIYITGYPKSGILIFIMIRNDFRLTSSDNYYQ